jgi:hypothetical protein
VVRYRGSGGTDGFLPRRPAPRNARFRSLTRRTERATVGTLGSDAAGRRARWVYGRPEWADRWTEWADRWTEWADRWTEWADRWTEWADRWTEWVDPWAHGANSRPKRTDHPTDDPTNDRAGDWSDDRIEWINRTDRTR